MHNLIKLFALLTCLFMLSRSARSDDAVAETAEAQALVDRWLAIQNRGDFGAYDLMYAQRFTGIRRTGTRVAHFDRQHWMEDRRRMFQKPTKVSISDLSIVATPSSAVVRFSQTWESGGYKDVGPKQLLLVREFGAFKIAGEEMLSSKKVLANTPSTNQSTGNFLFVQEDGVVLDANGDISWAIGHPKIIKRTKPIVVTRNIDIGKLPASLALWKGRAVRIIDDRGDACEATIKGFHLTGRVMPHFGTFDEWKKLPEAKRAAQAWTLSQTYSLVGELSAPCSGFFARLSTLPTPAIAPAAIEPPNSPMEMAAVNAFRKLPPYQSLLAEYKTRESEHKPYKGPWEDENGALFEVRIIRTQEHGKPLTLISLTAEAGPGCGEFEGRLWALWDVTERKGKFELHLRNRPEVDEAVIPESALDVDGDGAPELLFRRGITGLRGPISVAGLGTLLNGRFQEINTLSVQYLGCSC